MRRFKVKNRQKRKYTRKAELPQRDSITKTAWFGFVPISLIAIGLFTTTLITNPIISKNLAGVEIPQEVVNTIEWPLQISSQIVGKTLINTTTAISQIDTTPVTNALIRFGIWLITTVQKTFIILGNFLIAVLRLTGELLLAFIKTLGNVARVCINGIIRFFQLVGTGVVSLTNLIVKGILLTVKAATYFLLTTIRFIGAMTIALGRGIVTVVSFIIETIINISVAICNWFVNLFIAIGKALDAFFEAIVKLIEVPFIAFWKGYKFIEPGILFIVGGIGNAMSELGKSIVQIVNFSAKITQK